MISLILSLVGSAVVLGAVIVSLWAMTHSRGDPFEDRTATAIRIVAFLFAACAFKYALTF